jgi:hypothetical protein
VHGTVMGLIDIEAAQTVAEGGDPCGGTHEEVSSATASISRTPWGGWQLLAVLKPNRIIRKRSDANCGSFHLRVLLGLSNSRDRGRLALYLHRVITLVKEKLRLT